MSPLGKEANSTPVEAGQYLSINVRDFGATGNGKTDDGPAINRALDALRQKQAFVGRFNTAAQIVFPSGIYLTNETLNFVNLKGFNLLLDGCSSVIVGQCGGQPIIDALGARWLTVRDLTVVGGQPKPPSIGIQVGMLGKKTQADNHLFENVKVIGRFSFCCLYNRAAETSGFDHVFLWNDEPNSYCLVQDGLNFFDIRSSFGQNSMPVKENTSFNENEFINCDFRHSAGGTPIWLGDTSRHAFIRCYAATNRGSIVELYCGRNSHSMLDFDCHCETDAVSQVFLFKSPSPRIYVNGLSYKDHNCFASQFVFAADDNIKHISIQNGKIEVAGNSGPNCKIFQRPEIWNVYGFVYVGTRKAWNGEKSFVGYFSSRDDFSTTGWLDQKIRSGGAVDRPINLGKDDEGVIFRDRNLNKVIIWNGETWYDFLGNRV